MPSPDAEEYAVFKMKECPENFLETARWRFVNAFEVDAAADAVFDIIVDDEKEKEWFPGFVGATWETPLPHAAGSVRIYRLSYMTIREEFTVWDRGSRVSFWVSETTLPLTQRFLEDYRIEDVGNGRTRVTWQVCYEPFWFTRILHPILRVVFRKEFQQATRHLEAFIAEQSRE